MCGHEAARAVGGHPAPRLDVVCAEPLFRLPCRFRVVLVADEKLVRPALAKAGVDVNVNDPPGLADPTWERLPQVLSRALHLYAAEEKTIRVFVLPDRNGLAQLREPETQYRADCNWRRPLVSRQQRAFCPTLRENRRKRLECVRFDLRRRACRIEQTEQSSVSLAALLVIGIPVKEGVIRQE